MKFSKSLFCILFLFLFSSNLYCADDSFELTSRERAQRWLANKALNVSPAIWRLICSRRYAEMFYAYLYGWKPTSVLYKKISNRTQELLEIPEKKRLDPFKFHCCVKEGDRPAGLFAHVFFPRIYLDERLLSALSYGSKRFVVGHECVHYKQHLAQPWYSTKEHFIMNPAIYRNHEKEADLEALKFLACRKCVFEAFIDGYVGRDSEALAEYATVKEVVDLVKSEEKSFKGVCDYHCSYYSNFLIRHRKAIRTIAGVLAGTAISFAFSKHFDGKLPLSRASWMFPWFFSIPVAAKRANLIIKKGVQQMLEDKIAAGELKP